MAKMNEDERRRCPACDSSDARSSGSKNGFDFFVCRSCKTIFTGRLPMPDEDEDYDNYYSESNLSAPDFVVERIGEIIGDFSAFRETNRLLDVGFGAGTIMDVATEMGWDVCGTEVSQPAVDHAKAKGRTVHHGTLKSAKFPDSHFDVVTASEILEHLADPVGELVEIFRILRPGGLFWGTTPSARSISFTLMGQDWTVLCPPDHTQLYSKVGARLMLKKAGFSSIRFQTLGLNPSEILNFYRRRTTPEGPFDRVGTSYALNEKMTRSPARKLVKGGLNMMLDVLQIGDSLKIFAVK